MHLDFIVNEHFIEYRDKQTEVYNRRGRSEKQHKMAVDCEIVEWSMIDDKIWYYHPNWTVDAITADGRLIDCKFVQKFWNVSRDRTLNILRQAGIVDEFFFYEWIERPNRPLEVHDRVSVRFLGRLPFKDVANNLRKSYKEPDGFYLDVRKLLGDDQTDD